MPWRADDEPDVITGGREDERPVAGRSTMLRQWHQIVDDAVEEHNGDPNISYSVFNKHIRELREEGFTDPVIRGGFIRFAEQVRAQTIDVRGKPAWLVFWSRRRRLVRQVVYIDKLPDSVPAAPNPLAVEARPPPNPFDV